MTAPGVFALGAVILAAGRSTRMGRSKSLLPWGQTTIIGHLLGQWQALGAVQIAVVCAADDQPLQSELERAGLLASAQIHNPAPETGMFDSIRLAAAWKGWQPYLTHWAVVLGDQPHLPHDFLRSLLAQARAHPDKIWQPGFEGRGRHPVILPGKFLRLLKTEGVTDLKNFLARHAGGVALWSTVDAAFSLDLDRPEDYEAVRSRFEP